MMTDSDSLMNERLNSLLNNSLTKQAYSFGKAFRFKKYIKKDIEFNFYNIPEKKDKRATTLGYGKKCNYNQNIVCGSNKLYAAPSYFDPAQHNAPVYSFGTSRPKKRKEEGSPGPKYNCRINIEKGIPSYIFGKSGMNKNRRLKKCSSLPGPGAYFAEKDHKLSESFSSSLMNSANVVIGHEKRFLNKYKDKTPGPGQYNIPGLITKTGMLYNSKYISIPARSFLGSRNIEALRQKDITPGPGHYNSFSIFEGYSKAIVPKK